MFSIRGKNSAIMLDWTVLKVFLMSAQALDSTLIYLLYGELDCGSRADVFF